MKLIRRIVRFWLVLLDRLFPAGREVSRSPSEGAVIRERLRPYALYQLVGCPFCIKVRRTLRRLDIDGELELRNCERGPWREELIREGGMMQAPCLRIPATETEAVRWLYESDAIIAYLREFVSK